MDVFEGIGLPELINSALGKGERPRPLQLQRHHHVPFLHISLRRRPHRGHHVLSGRHFSMRPNTKAASSDTIACALKELAPGQCHLQERLRGVIRFQHGGKTEPSAPVDAIPSGPARKGRRAGPGLRPPVHPAGKHDAKYSYKRAYGYFPGILSFGGLLLGIENRDGNANVRFHQEDTLKRFLKGS